MRRGDRRNPFLLTALLAELPTGALTPAQVRDCGPAALAPSLVARLASAGPACVAVADAMTVLGEGVPLRLVAALSGLRLPTASRAVDRLEQLGLVRPGRPVGFAHGIVRQALYDHRPAGERSLAHAAAARLLAADGATDEQVAAQLLWSEPAGSAWVTDRLLGAARHALGEGAPDSAVRYLRRAVEEHGHRRDEVLLELGRAEARLSLPDANAHLRAVLGRAEDASLRASAAIDLARLLLALGEPASATDAVDAVISTLGPQDVELALRLECERLPIAMGSVSRAGTAAQRLLAATSTARQDGPLSRLVLAERAVARRMLRGDRQECRALARKALSDGRFLAEHGCESASYYLLCSMLVDCDELEEAQRLLDAALTEAAAHGSVYGYAFGSTWRSWARLRAGDIRGAVSDATAVLDVDQETGYRFHQAVAVGTLAEALLERGELAQADAVIGSALAQQLDDQSTSAHLWSVAARIQLLAGNPAAARENALTAGHVILRLGQDLPNATGRPSPTGSPTTCCSSWRSWAWCPPPRSEQTAALRKPLDAGAYSGPVSDERPRTPSDPPPRDPGHTDPARDDPPPALAPTSEPRDDLVTTSHAITTAAGRLLQYTATTGRVVLREETYEDGTFTGSPAKAEVSLTAYLLDGADPATRPVTFAFNGGPGSSSVWLHLGLLGPRRVVTGDVGSLVPPPYAFADNAETLLAVSDLVFLDPVSTGYSRVVKGTKPAAYHGYQGDVESVGELVRLWLSRHGRWMSPKVLAGESYGTLRAAALAELLQNRYGVYLNGLVFLSSVLDLGSIDFDRQRNDRAHANYLPTYAAVAHYHGKLGDRPLQEVLDEAEAYAARDYPYALDRGSRLTAQERATAVDTLARLTGLTEDYVDRADLRIEHLRFCGELLRRERRVVGRLDGRFTGPAGSPIAEVTDADPSYDAIVGPYAAAMNHYVRTELGYASDLHYEQISPRVQPWSFKDFEGRPVDATPRLERAMRQNPHLLVHVAYGVYDLATPPGAAHDVLAHLRVPDELRENIEHATYPAGHMMYVHEPSRLQQSRDIADFVQRACGSRP